MNRPHRIPHFALIALLAFGALTSCTNDGPSYLIPDTYNFENVDISGQSTRQDMLAEMTIYMKTGNSSGNTLDGQVLKDMFENLNDRFSFQSSKNLKDKCFLPDVAYVEGMMDSLALASSSVQPGSNGTAGVVLSGDGTKQYLLDENGKEYTQLIEKTLMGAIFYYQATAVYLSEDRIGPSVDNTTVTVGKGTNMEHHWDEAFGYLGVPSDFPANTDNARFFGKYSNDRDAVLETNRVLMTAFLTGRAAISNDDMETKDIQVVAIRQAWERVIAGTAIHYLNGARRDIADDALRNHQLSEAYAFVWSLQYNPAKRITDSERSAVLAHFGSNFYEIAISDIDAAINDLSAIYALDAVKDQL